MLIGIDGNEANIKNRVGVGQYAFHLLVNLYKLDKNNNYIIYLKESPLTDLPKPNSHWQYRVFGPKKLWTKFALPIYLFTQKEKLDLFYSPSHYSPQLSPFPTIPTIHDLGYIKFQDQFTKKDLYQLINWTKRSILKAKKIITVSQFSKTEIQKEYNVADSKISIAYNGVDNPLEFSNKDSLKVLKKFSINKPYFLYLGTLKPNKNIPFLIKSFAKFLKDNKNLDYLLVIAGKKGWLYEEIFKTVKAENIKDKVIFTDYINELEKWVLYKNADSLILPSLYEGFGIPVIEAMKVGTPVLASNIPVLNEVIDKAGLFFNPTNINDLSKKMLQIIKMNKKELAKLGQIQSNKFTWQNTAKSVIDVFKNINT
jgi:glycosyltransferase involved in cell wall biosynthesis